MSGPWAIGPEDVRAAAARIEGRVHRTPVITCATLDGLAGRELFFKCENLQRTGSFKLRGALNAVLALDDAAAARGVVTHSSGNHAQALALAARLRGVPATVVMPADSPPNKQAAVRGYGGRVVLCAPTLAARQEAAEAAVARTGGTLVHPSDDPLVMAGQGTAALELLEQVPDLDAVVVPVGGGGLASGVAMACLGRVRVFAAEPAGADDAARSKASGQRVTAHTPHTVADGLRTVLGPNTWPVVRDLVERVITVDDDAIVAAMRLHFERMKLVVEPSGAVPLAAVLSEAFASLDGLERVGVVLSGGNADLDRLPWVLG